MWRRLATAGPETLVGKLLNTYDPPPRPIARILISLIFIFSATLGVAASSFDIHVRNAFDAAPACPAIDVDLGCRGTQTARVGNIDAEHNSRGDLTGYRIYLEPSPWGYDPEYDSLAVTGWFDVGTPPHAFIDATTVGSTVNAEIFNSNTVALSANGITVRTDKWPSSLARTDIGTVLLSIVITWLLLRSAGRALLWRAFGGRRRGWPLHTMRLLDLGTLAIGVAGGIVLDFHVAQGIAMISIAGALLVLAVLVPATLVRVVRVTGRTEPLWG